VKGFSYIRGETIKGLTLLGRNSDEVVHTFSDFDDGFHCTSIGGEWSIFHGDA
jgi:hypothetical protein